MTARRAVLLTLLVVACSENPAVPEPGAPSLLVLPETVTVLENDSALVTLSFVDSDGQAADSQAVVWQIADTTIARVDSRGMLHWVRPQSTTLGVLSGGSAYRVHVNAAVRFQQWVPMFWGLGPAQWVRDCGITTTGRFYCNGLDSLRAVSLPAGVVPRLLGTRTRDGSVCFIATSGKGYCEGYNGFGAVGTGDTVSFYYTPSEIAGGHTFSRIAAGGHFACALDTAGAAWCWGLGGTSGDSTFLRRMSPVPVAGGHVFKELAVGYFGSCAIALDGAAWCWGPNDGGQLGVGSTINSRALYPVQVASGAMTFKTISVGEAHSCGTATDDTGWCWGLNSFGQLGVASTETCAAGPCATTPQPLGLGPLRALSAGDKATCAVDATGIARCWGPFNDAGYQGPPVPPAIVSSTVKFNGVVVTSATACGVTEAGIVMCWAGRFGSTGPRRVANQP